RAGDAGKIAYTLKGTSHRLYTREAVDAYFLGDYEWASINQRGRTAGSSPLIGTRAHTPLRRYRINRRTGEREQTKQLPKLTTVNRQVVEPMRRLLRRAKTVWRLPVDTEEFDWKTLRYDEPAERTCELSPEEQRFWEAIRADYAPICEMYIIS